METSGRLNLKTLYSLRFFLWRSGSIWSDQERSELDPKLVFLWYGPDQFYAYFLARISIPCKVLSICINLKFAQKNKPRTDLDHTKETWVSDRVQIALGRIRLIQITKGKTLKIIIYKDNNNNAFGNYLHCILNLI